VKTKATMQSNQTGRNALGRSLPGALLGASPGASLCTLMLTLNNISGHWSLARSANLAAAALYPAAKPSVLSCLGATSKCTLSFYKRMSDWTHSIRGDHSPCCYG
jgi:hypothetical protein